MLQYRMMETNGYYAANVLSTCSWSANVIEKPGTRDADQMYSSTVIMQHITED